MAMKIIDGYDDPEWESYKDLFYENFNPDDWDYIIEGNDEFSVDALASKLMVCDYDVKKIGDKFYAVTYHS